MEAVGSGTGGTERVSGQWRAVARQWLPSVLGGLALAVLVAGVVASRRTDWPRVVTLVVFTAAVWPVLTAGLQILWFDRHRSAEVEAAGEHDVETARVRDASATAFAATMGGLLFLEGVGGALDVAWMAPVGLAHALLLGVGGFGLTWGWLRIQGR